MPPIIFFDGSCPLCNRAIGFVLQADRKKLFLFAPLEGITAEKLLPHAPKETLVLLDGEHVYTASRAVLRLLWLLGGRYKLVGILCFLPPFLFDWLYRYVARRRYSLFAKQQKRELTQDRLLP